VSRIRKWLLFARLAQNLGRIPRPSEVIEFCDVTRAAAQRMVREYIGVIGP